MRLPCRLDVSESDAAGALPARNWRLAKSLLVAMPVRAMPLPGDQSDSIG